MNRFFTLGVVTALATTMVPMAEAKPDKDERGGRGGGGGGGGRQAAPAQRAPAQRVAPQARASFRAQPQRAPSRVLQNRVAGSERSFVQPARRQSSVAIQNNRNRNVSRDVDIRNRNINIERNTNRFRSNNYTNVNRFESRRWSPPYDVHRHWDHNRVHVWNNNRYRWYNNAWVIIDGGYYGSPYYYSGAPYYYDTTPDYYTTSSYLPAVGENVAAEVQEELARRGYSPGPIDGVIGGQTRNAIASFQADRGLAVTGTINRALLDELGI